MTEKTVKTVEDFRTQVQDSVKRWLRRQTPKSIRRKVYHELDSLLPKMVLSILGIEKRFDRLEFVRNGELKSRLENKVLKLAEEWIETVFEKITLPSEEQITEVIRTEFTETFRDELESKTRSMAISKAREIAESVAEALTEAEIEALCLDKPQEAQSVLRKNTHLLSREE